MPSLIKGGVYAVLATAAILLLSSLSLAAPVEDYSQDEYGDVLISDKTGVQYDDVSKNFTGDNSTDPVGNCFIFTPESGGNQTLTATIGTSFRIKSKQVQLNITFLQNATYSSDKTVIYGDQSSALQEIRVAEIDSQSQEEVQASFKHFGDFDMAMDYQTSYKCKYNFTYSTNDTVNGMRMNISIYNVHVQPFLPKGQNKFSDSVKRIGLIVGGALTGLAFLGIIIFSIAACRRTSGYTTLN
eukprot:gene3636-6215_t